MEPETFMTEIKEMISSLVTTTEAVKGANALMKNKIIGVCPNCGAKKPEGSNGWICPECGTKDILSKFCPNCGARKPEEKHGWICPDCGTKDIMTNFCPNCGRKKDESC